MKNAEIEKISHREYFKIAISVDCVIFGYDNKDLKVLLIKSDLEEFNGLWSLLGDLVKIDEALETAPYRVLKERTGLSDVYLEQVQTFGSLNRHPSGRVITTAFYTLMDINHSHIKIADNELHWHSVDDIKKMAFDHKLIIEKSLNRLREKIIDSPIVFNLLPEKFSLRQLQSVYEAILGTELDRRNFRKKIALKNWVEDIDELEDNVPHRPGKLFKLNKGYLQKKKSDF